MFQTRFPAGLLSASLLLWSSAAFSHFQLLYSPELIRDRGGEVILKMPFTHPAESGQVMKMPRPEAFYVVHKANKTDLSETLEPIQWTSASNSDTAWQARTRLRGLGDFSFVLEPTPYYEASEEKYIQQITKTIINVGSLPTDWDSDLGLKTEIRPLVRPYALYSGGIFRGVVLSSGEPVGHAEIEVEYLNYTPDMGSNAFAKQGKLEYAADALANQSIRADAHGNFSFALPKAGLWGFAALEVGPDREYLDKPLSQDAVIWVQAHDMELY